MIKKQPNAHSTFGIYFESGYLKLLYKYTNFVLATSSWVQSGNRVSPPHKGELTGSKWESMINMAHNDIIDEKPCETHSLSTKKSIKCIMTSEIGM